MQRRLRFGVAGKTGRGPDVGPAESGRGGEPVRRRLLLRAWRGQPGPHAIGVRSRPGRGGGTPLDSRFRQSFASPESRSHAGLCELLPRRFGRVVGHRQSIGQLHSERGDQPDDHSCGRGPETSLLVLPPGTAGLRPAARSGRVAVSRAAGCRTGRHPAGMVHAGPSRVLLAMEPCFAAGRTETAHPSELALVGGPQEPVRRDHRTLAKYRPAPESRNERWRSSRMVRRETA